MKTYDAILLLIVIAWWLAYRKRYDWKTVVLYYVGGVFVADLFCAVLILALYKQRPGITASPEFLMPIGGIVALICGASTGKLSRRVDSGKTNNE